MFSHARNGMCLFTLWQWCTAETICLKKCLVSRSLRRRRSLMQSYSSPLLAYSITITILSLFSNTEKDKKIMYLFLKKYKYEHYMGGRSFSHLSYQYHICMLLCKKSQQELPPNPLLKQELHSRGVHYYTSQRVTPPEPHLMSLAPSKHTEEGL